MDVNLNDVANELVQNHIKPSIHRIKVLGYLIDQKDHPTVDEIYVHLKKDCPTLSKATVYNAVSMFVNAGLVKALTIEGTEVRYDYTKPDHGHFKCEECGAIVDFDINISNLSFEGLDQCKILKKDVNFKGICSECLSNIKRES